MWRFDTYQKQERKVFLSQGAIVDSPANLLHKRHSGRNTDQDTRYCISHKNYFQLFFGEHKQILCHRSIATQRYLPYTIWHKIWQGYGIRHSITISLYNDITIERCIQIMGMMRENAKAKIALPAPLSKCDYLQKSANAIMPLCQSNAILCHPRAKIIASRLHLLILLMRTVSSDNISMK